MEKHHKTPLQFVQQDNTQPVELSPMELVKLSEPPGLANKLTIQQQREITIAYSQMIQRALKGEPISPEPPVLQKGSNFVFSNPEGANRWSITIIKLSGAILAGGWAVSYTIGSLASAFGVLALSMAGVRVFVILALTITTIYMVFFKLPKRRIIEHHDCGPGQRSGTRGGGDINIKITQNNY